MKAFNYYQPTEIIFGLGRVKEIGQIARRYGTNCLLVTVSEFDAVAPLYRRVKQYLIAAGINVSHFDGVIPNPTTDVVTEGALLAERCGAEVIIGLGGGSSMDAAKAIAVEATHEGTAWDYLFYKKEPSDKTLPIIAVTTTSGTGSQTTPCSVITKTDECDKSALWHPNIFPKVAIVDPELMLTLPPDITAITGFDAFSHNFEAYISNGTNPYVEALALSAIGLIVKYLPIAVKDGSNIEAREAMAWADTLGGIAIASAGVTLPHGLGMQVGGHCPQVAHGQALAVIYPEFTRYTYKSALEKFAAVGRLFNPDLETATDEKAAELSCDEIDSFIKEIGIWHNFKELGVSEEEIRLIADDGHVLGDYKNNPRIATIEEMYQMLKVCYDRNI
jgi:alcohol dehydrogenase class IV